MKHEPINQPVAVPIRAKVVMEMLSGAAERGDPCPSNDLLGGAIDAAANTASSVVSLLETMGLITVERFVRGRIVTIVSTGKSTRKVIGRPVMFLDGRRRSVKLPWNSRETIETFADDLAEGCSIAAAAYSAGITVADGRRLFKHICADLGAQAA